MTETQDVRFAGFWARVGAAVLDLVVFTLMAVPLLYAIHGRGYFKSDVIDRGAVDFLNMFVVPNLLTPLLWLLCSATPGKMAFSVKIVDVHTGQKPRARQFLLRFLGYYISALPLGLGFLWIAFDRKKQGWHDKLAGTTVVCTHK